MWLLPHTPILAKGSLYLYLLLWNRQLSGQTYFSTWQSGCPNDTPPIQFLWTGNVGSVLASMAHSAFHPTILSQVLPLRCFISILKRFTLHGGWARHFQQYHSRSCTVTQAVQCLALFLERHVCQWAAQSVSSWQFPGHAATKRSSGWHSQAFLLANGTSPNSYIFRNS